MISMPVQAISQRESIRAKMLTAIGDQISRDYPARLTEAMQVVGDGAQRGPYD